MSLAAKKVLIVDDDKDLRLLLKKFLEDGGYECSLAEGGKEALQSLRSAAADLVLLDIMMPEMDGFAVLEELKKDRDLRSVPVVMLTGEAKREAVLQALDLGAVGYCVKPPTKPILLERLQSIIEKLEADSGAAFAKGSKVANASLELGIELEHLSPNQLRVLSPAPLKESSVHRLNTDFFPSLELNSSPQFRVLKCQQVEGSDNFRVEFEILQLNEDDRARIRKWVMRNNM